MPKVRIRTHHAIGSQHMLDGTPESMAD